MKQMIARTLTSLLLIVVWLAATARAQSTPWVIKVNIPFEFNVGDQAFPAGSYSLVQPLQHLLVLRDARGQTIASAFSGGIDSPTPMASTKLKFDSFGGRHILSEVWQQQQSTGERLYPTKRRTTFAKRRSAEARETAEGSQP
jgi:hypothetical protein